MKTILGTTKLRINDPTQQLFIFISVNINLVFVGSIVDWINTVKYDIVGNTENEVLDNIIQVLLKINPGISYSPISKMKDEIDAELERKELQFARIKEEINSQEGLNSLLPHEEQNLQKNRFKANSILYDLGILKTALQRVKIY